MTEGFVAALREEARKLGFESLGIAGVEPSAHMDHYREWIGLGFHGEMRYLSRPEAIARRGDLALTLEGARSVVVVTEGYDQRDPPGIPEDAMRGVVARYARGEDYHDRMKERLLELLSWVQAEARARGLAETVRGAAYVDTGPILERELAVRAGLGWFGKNTLLLAPRRGSYLFLGVLLLDLKLPPDEPFTREHCGSCSACLEACPTGALLGRTSAGAPLMDARRCISYLTIELKGPIPRDLRRPLGNRIFGCDICQEVCPWNRRFSTPARQPAYRAGPDTDGPRLTELLGLTEEEFRARFSGSPIKRAKRRGFLRNVAVALGNAVRAAEPELAGGAVLALSIALDDPEPLVRGHAAWALGEALRGEGVPAVERQAAATALLARAAREEDLWVREEVGLALGGGRGEEDA